MKQHKNRTFTVCSLLLALTLAFTSVFLTACSNKDDGGYPITVGNVKLKRTPQNITVLSANAIDVMSNLGCSAIVARSDGCTQESVKLLASVGSAAAPDIDAIINSNTDLVIADETLSEFSLEKLREEQIPVLRLAEPKTEDERRNYYITIGKILGAEDGAKNAESRYDALYSEISSSAASAFDMSTAYTVCYIFLDENGNLALSEKGSFIDRLICASGSVNITADEQQNFSVSKTIEMHNPSFIFYDGSSTLEKLKAETAGGDIYAINQNQCFDRPKKDLELIGSSAVHNVSEMLSVMYSQRPSSVGGSTTIDPSDITSPTDETDPPQSGDLSSQYGVTITEDTVIDENSDTELIAALQQRLKDLNYYTGDVDGRMGELTERCISDFQFLNNFTVDEIADSDVLSAMFNSTAIPLNN